MTDHVNARREEIEGMARAIFGGSAERPSTEWRTMHSLPPEQDQAEQDPTNPDHYRQHPSGVEAITITEHMSFCLGNVVKYVMRAGLKTDDPVEDLSKAHWYLQREIERLENKEQA